MGDCLVGKAIYIQYAAPCSLEEVWDMYVLYKSIQGSKCFSFLSLKRRHEAERTFLTSLAVSRRGILICWMCLDLEDGNIGFVFGHNSPEASCAQVSFMSVKFV